jgi:hypothetical protein
MWAEASQRMAATRAIRQEVADHRVVVREALRAVVREDLRAVVREAPRLLPVPRTHLLD